MTPSVDDYRNEIRVAVGYRKRLVSAGFTAEPLAAVCDALGDPVGDGSPPSKSEMRTRVRERVADLDAHPGTASRPFGKAELEPIAAALSENSG
ncbi:hypothetical protein [Halobaculum sp. EA56]|uniref:hypothetical protein n=1 Tax=Halobaculum sp. EA56 TaxID=3421648 RepID=UPI003EBC39E4